MTPPEKLDYGIIPSERARDGLRMLGEDISNYLNGKKENVKTEKRNGAIINNIYNYGTGTPSRPSVKFGFAKDLWTVLVMTGIIVGTYIVITNPEAVIDLGIWLKSIF